MTAVRVSGIGVGKPMTSTKLMYLGILIMLLCFAVTSVTMRIIELRAFGFDAVQNLSYLAVALFVVGFIVGVVGFFRR